MWPSSPVVPRPSPTRRPSATTPSARPVEALTTSMVSAAGTCPKSSERVRAAVSLSTCSGASVTGLRNAERSTPSQPRSTGASMLQHFAGSTLPGRLSPTPATRVPRRSAMRDPSRSATDGIRSPALVPGSWSRVSPAISRPARSKTPTWLRERPTATASTTAASGFRCSEPAGRPPVEAWSPPSRSSPASVRAARREVTAPRERPVSRTRSARGLARPVRTSVRRPPGEVSATLMSGSEPQTFVGI